MEFVPCSRCPGSVDELAALGLETGFRLPEAHRQTTGAAEGPPRHRFAGRVILTFKLEQNIGQLRTNRLLAVMFVCYIVGLAILTYSNA